MIKSLDSRTKRNLLLSLSVSILSLFLLLCSIFLPLFGKAGASVPLIPYINSTTTGLAFMGWGYFFCLVFAVFFTSVDVFFILHEGQKAKYWGIPAFVFPFASGVFALFIAPTYHALFIFCFIIATLGLAAFCFSL